MSEFKRNKSNIDTFDPIEPSHGQKPEPRVKSFGYVAPTQPHKPDPHLDDVGLIEPLQSHKPEPEEDDFFQTRQRSNAFAVSKQDEIEVDHSLGIKWNHRQSTVQKYHELNDGTNKLSNMVDAMKDTKAYRLEKEYQDKVKKANEGSAWKRPFKKAKAWISKKWHGTEDKKGKAKELAISTAVGTFAPIGVNEYRKAENIEDIFESEQKDIRESNGEIGDMSFTSHGWKRGVDFNRKAAHIKNAASLATSIATLGVDSKIPGAKSVVLSAAQTSAKLAHERGGKLSDFVKQANSENEGFIEQDSIAKESYQYAALLKKQKLDALQTVRRSEKVSKQTTKEVINKKRY